MGIASPARVIALVSRQTSAQTIPHRTRITGICGASTGVQDRALGPSGSPVRIPLNARTALQAELRQLAQLGPTVGPAPRWTRRPGAVAHDAGGPHPARRAPSHRPADAAMAACGVSITSAALILLEQAALTSDWSSAQSIGSSISGGHSSAVAWRLPARLEAPLPVLWARLRAKKEFPF